MKTRQLNFELPDDLREALFNSAKAVDCSVSKFIRDAVREKLDRIRRSGRTETPVLDFGRTETAVAR